jgi:uncharacterized protein YndB with AHSA1/START domain
VTSIEPVRKQITIDAAQAHVFKVFTDGIDKWWPRDHHIGTSPLKQVIIEPKLGGRWYSVSEDGTENGTGKVLAWDPPNRVVLAWQITADWKYDPEFVTEVEVTFTAEGPKKTRVDLEHRNLARYGVAAEATRAMFDSPGAWEKTLAAFASVAAA